MYFPRFFHFFHETMETWFDGPVGSLYADLIGRRKLGFPAVHTEADFRVPCAMGEEIAVEQRVVNLGRTSIRFAYTVRGVADPAGPERLTGVTVCVAMDLDQHSKTFRQPIAIPYDLRHRIAPLVCSP